MDLKTMKTIAERELFRYRDNKAYVQGVIDAGGDPRSLRFPARAAWALAVEYAVGHFERTDPAKAAFLSAFYHLERPPKRFAPKRTMSGVAMRLHVSDATLYRWKNEVLTAVVFAAIQTGALRPFGIEAENGSDADVHTDRKGGAWK